MIISVEELLQRYEKGERDFAGAELWRVKLEDAELPGINLSKANLHGADLNRANHCHNPANHS